MTARYRFFATSAHEGGETPWRCDDHTTDFREPWRADVEALQEVLEALERIEATMDRAKQMFVDAGLSGRPLQAMKATEVDRECEHVCRELRAKLCSIFEVDRVSVHLRRERAADIAKYLDWVREVGENAKFFAAPKSAELDPFSEASFIVGGARAAIRNAAGRPGPRTEGARLLILPSIAKRKSPLTNAQVREVAPMLDVASEIARAPTTVRIGHQWVLGTDGRKRVLIPALELDTAALFRFLRAETFSNVPGGGTHRTTRQANLGSSDPPGVRPFTKQDSRYRSRRPGKRRQELEASLEILKRGASPRQLEIIELLMKGHSQVAVAKTLGIAASTVRNQLARIRDHNGVCVSKK